MLNQQNERTKYNYRIYLSKNKGKDPKTWRVELEYIQTFEKYIKFANFEKFTVHKASEYIDDLVSNKSLAYCHNNVRVLYEFYFWLMHQRGYKRKIDFNKIACFRLTDNQRRTARTVEYKKSYELHEIRKAIDNVPQDGIVNMRTAALISLQTLVGLRISEIQSMKLKHLIFDKDSNRWIVYIHPKDMVNVKRAKNRYAFFMPFDQKWVDNVMRWRDLLISKGWVDKDPFFPAISCNFVKDNIGITEFVLEKKHIKTSNVIIKLFRNAFIAVGLEYIRPHNFRHTIARWAEHESPAVFNAVSQSLGHSQISTTFNSYGKFTPTKIGEILNEVKEPEREQS